MDDLSRAIRAEVAAAVSAALADHRPKYAVSYEEAAHRLSCSTRAICNLVADGVLRVVPRTRSITVGSLRAAADLAALPPTGDLASIDVLEEHREVAAHGASLSSGVSDELSIGP